jgi:HD-GYP domain-containing protein (c-di-GMP phosphodiesterase class II)
MNAPVRFLISLAQTLSKMGLYSPGHPSRERAVDDSFAHLQRLCEDDLTPRFSFLASDVIYNANTLRELRDWEWSSRFSDVGIQRLEFSNSVTRDDFEEFLIVAMARLGLGNTPEAITAAARIERATGVRFGMLSVRGTAVDAAQSDPLAMLDTPYSLSEEIETVQWMHDEVLQGHAVEAGEADAVVRSLALALHANQGIKIPLLQLTHYDQYTTTHSLNVSVLAMALGERLGLARNEVRAIGVSGLLHDLGKVRIPAEILQKPGRLTEREWEVMRRHPEDGARLILGNDAIPELAAVVAFEHHIMLDGGGYPHRRKPVDCHTISKIVHVCDLYDALRTNRPYRPAWTSAKVLNYIEERIGTELEGEAARAFIALMSEAEPIEVPFEEAAPVYHR